MNYAASSAAADEVAHQIEALGGEAIVVGANLGKVRRAVWLWCGHWRVVLAYLWYALGLQAVRGRDWVLCLPSSSPGALYMWFCFCGDGVPASFL